MSKIVLKIGAILTVLTLSSAQAQTSTPSTAKLIQEEQRIEVNLEPQLDLISRPDSFGCDITALGQQFRKALYAATDTLGNDCLGKCDFSTGEDNYQCGQELFISSGAAANFLNCNTSLYGSTLDGLRSKFSNIKLKKFDPTKGVLRKVAITTSLSPEGVFGFENPLAWQISNCGVLISLRKLGCTANLSGIPIFQLPTNTFTNFWAVKNSGGILAYDGKTDYAGTSGASKQLNYPALASNKIEITDSLRLSAFIAVSQPLEYLGGDIRAEYLNAFASELPGSLLYNQQESLFLKITLDYTYSPLLPILAK